MNRRRVLIETSWNVKRILPSFSLRPASVLIETSWNVKVDLFERVQELLAVLIETSWNVKGRKIKLKARVRDGINRNIVECKDSGLISSVELYWY